MGILNKLFEGGEDSRAEPDPETEADPEIVIEEPDGDGYVHGSFRGHRVAFQQVKSPDGEWTCLVSQAGGSEASPIVLLNPQREVQYAFTVTSTRGVAVANTGHIAVNDGWDYEDERGTFSVLNPDGEPILQHEFDSRPVGCTITEDATYASTTTENPDGKGGIFAIDSGEIVAEFELPEFTTPRHEFGVREGDLVLYLMKHDIQHLAIDFDGNIVWKSSVVEEKERFAELIEESEEVPPAEAVELLEEAYELSGGEGETKSTARKLANAYWELAKELKKEQGDTDEWWSSLNKAKEYYTEVLPWYDGKKGLAKVQRKQAKYHLKEGNEEFALELWQNIAGLEKEYDVQLLTDADKEKIEELST